MRLSAGVEGRMAIADVLTDYRRMLDRMDLAALVALFTEDCEVIFGLDPRLRAEGRGELAASMARMWRWHRTAHHLSNLRVSFDADRQASAEIYVHAWHERPDCRDFRDLSRQTGAYRGRLADRTARDGDERGSGRVSRAHPAG